MRAVPTNIAAALASALLAAVPASAQYSTQPSPTPQIQAPRPAQTTDGRKFDISRAARKPIIELQKAVNSNDVAKIPAALAAAQAAAQTADDRYVIAQLQLKAALAAKDEVASAAALEALLATGQVPEAEATTLHLTLGKHEYKRQQYAKAASWLERVIAARPSETEALVLLAEARNSQGQVGDAVRLLERALEAKRANGQKADESWYKRAVALAYGAKLPGTVDLGRRWVAAYPTPANWDNALKLYREMTNPDPAGTLDALRLARATGALDETDVRNLAVLASDDSPGEARAVIDEAVAAKRVDAAAPRIKEISAYIAENKAMSRASLPALASEARSAAAARLAVRTADAYYGYGDFAQAAELYRTALTKTGVDADLVNLRLGMALARAGDKAGATSALNAVTGPRSELAKFWLVYVATRT